MSFPEQAVIARLTDRLYQKAGDRKIPLSGTFELSPGGCGQNSGLL